MRQHDLLLLSPGKESPTLHLLLKSGGLEKAVTADSGADAKASELAQLLTAVGTRRDRGAFAALFEFYSPRVKGYLMARGAAAATAEEIVQDVMLTVWHKSQQFDASRGSASAWIFTLARNAFTDCVRREHRPVVDPTDPLLQTPADAASQGQAPADQMMVDAESLRELATAVEALPAEQQRVVQGSYFQGQSLAEISVADRLPIGTVKTRARLALSRLRMLVSPRRES